MTEVAPDILSALVPVVNAFEHLGVPYYIGGSVASSIYGIARATLDVDLVAHLRLNHVSQLVGILQTAYYIDALMVSDAVRRKASFNLIHLPTMLKVDVFIPKEEPLDRAALRCGNLDRLAL